MTMKRAALSRRGLVGSAVLLLAVVALAAGLATWKRADLRASEQAAAHQQEPMESVTVAAAREIEHRRTTSAVGTVLALRSIVLRNELSGTVREVALEPGQVVEEGTLLVALDVAVEEAELAAQQAEADLAATLLGRMERALESRGASAADVDRAKAERDVALARVARTQAVIERKTLRAPFRARVGLADIHPGQYLVEGTAITTLQGIDEQAHVDFTVSQDVAAGLHEGDTVQVATHDETMVAATVVALDARVDEMTRNAMVRAQIAAEAVPAPGASVIVHVPVGPARRTVVVPVSALRKGPAGDHVFVIAPDDQGRPRAHLRAVQSGAVLGDDVLIESGVATGEEVAASGSFKLRDGVLVVVVSKAQGGDQTAVR